MFKFKEKMQKALYTSAIQYHAKGMTDVEWLDVACKNKDEDAMLKWLDKVCRDFRGYTTSIRLYRWFGGKQ